MSTRRARVHHRPPVGEAKAEKKALYIEALTKHLVHSEASRAIGIDRRQTYEWRKEDPEFEAACLAAQDIPVARLVATAMERALNEPDATGKRPCDDRTSAILLMFLIKGHLPQYKDSFKAEVDVGVVNFSLQIPKPPRLDSLGQDLPDMPLLTE